MLNVKLSIVPCWQCFLIILKQELFLPHILYFKTVCLFNTDLFIDYGLFDLGWHALRLNMGRHFWGGTNNYVHCQLLSFSQLINQSLGR